MGDLESDLEILTDDYIWIRQQFSLLKNLFAMQKQRIELMNAASPSFFCQIQMALVASILTGIFRIAGSKKSGRGDGSKENLVLMTLADVGKYGSWNEIDDYNLALRKLEDVLKPLQDIRHKQIAHRDADIARDVSTLRNPKFGEIEAAVKSIGNTLQIAQKGIRNTTFIFEEKSKPEAALHVLNLVRIGLEISEKEHEIELAEAKKGNYNFRGCYSTPPSWLE